MQELGKWLKKSLMGMMRQTLPVTSRLETGKREGDICIILSVADLTLS
jgi:hypothetical protein